MSTNRGEAKKVEPLESRVHALEEGVERIEEDVKGIRSDIKALAAAYAQGNRTDWKGWIAGAALLGGFLFTQSQLIVGPMGEAIRTNTVMTHKNENESDTLAIKIAEERVHRQYARRDIDELRIDTKTLTGIVLEAQAAMDAATTQAKGNP